MAVQPTTPNMVNPMDATEVKNALLSLSQQINDELSELKTQLQDIADRVKALEGA